MINKILHFLYYSLFLITPLVMFSQTSELFEFNKMLFIYAISSTVLFLWCVKMLQANKIIFRKTVLDIPIGLFFISQVLSTVFSIDIHTSLFGYYSRFNGGLISIISYIILYYALVSNFNEDECVSFMKRLIKISFIASIIVIAWGLPGRFGYDLSCFVFIGQLNNNCWTNQFRPAERMFSTLGQPNWLGAYLAVHFFIGLYYFITSLTEDKETLNKKAPYLYAGYMMLNYAAILFTRSRSTLLAVGGCFVLFLCYIICVKRTVLKYAGYLLIAFFAVTIIFKTGISSLDRFITPQWYGNKLFHTKKSFPENEQKSVFLPPEASFDVGVTTSYDIRKIVWKGAKELGLQYPVFGTGVETFAYSYYFVRPVEHNNTSEWDYLYNKAHNEYLNYLATTGFAGLASYILFIGWIMVIAFINIKNQILKIKIEENIIFYLLLGWITILITNFFGFSTTTVNLLFYCIPAFIIGLAVTKNNDVAASDAKNRQAMSLKDRILHSRKAMATFIIIVAAYIYCMTGIVSYFIADTKYALGDIYLKNGDYESAANLITQASQIRYEHVYEDKLSYAIANLAFMASYQKQTELSKKLMEMSIGYNTKSLKAALQNVMYWKTGAKNQYLFYQIDLNKQHLVEGIDNLGKARALSPTDPKIPYSLALFYTLLYDEEKKPTNKELYKAKSLQVIDETIALKKDYREGYFLKGQLLKKYGDIKGAKAVFQFILEHINPQDEEAKKELYNN